MLHLHNSARHALALACLALFAASHAAAAPAASSVYLEDLTSPELRDRIAAGTTTALVPIGGTEQSGPHIVLGKHNVRARVLAGRIAARLGDAVVAPVVAYVPEGAIAPPAGHMRFAGTLSIPDAAFEALLEATAKSLCRHGIRDVVFLGDHGGYQKNEQRAAARVNGAGGCRAHALAAYYDAATTGFFADLKRRGFSDAEIGTHAGLADTALSLAVDPALVRPAQVAAGARGGAAAGVHGDPTRATAELGQMGVERIVDASVAAIRAARQPASDPNPNPTKRK
jgi:creatinine amidohydrolase/Fe(II)-dependent formamide hydrolase-like protein